MKKKIITINVVLSLIFFCSITSGKSLAENATLTGRITDKQTGESLPGVSIYIPDLKKGTVTDTGGVYKIENLPATKVFVEINFLGYNNITEKIDLNAITVKDFSMEVSVAELNEVVVTGLSKSSERNRTPTSITTISPVQLKQLSTTNIIDAIATQPGISQVTTGSGISKPLIRGLGYNRVMVVNDEVRQEGQQWGDEHGVEIDEYSVHSVEILKGPASLIYGSDAMAGVINMLQAPTLPEGKIKGSILTNYQTNNGLLGCSANIMGNAKGFIWNIRYSNKLAHAYQNKFDGYVFNSGFRENNFGGIIGLNKSWGYSHLHFSSYEMTPGIVEGERDSISGKFVKMIDLLSSTLGS